ncbi:hypothetical protein RB195_011219 [Necator americanus]|uniref:Amino acid transporter transmembrane domain-containing protein n=1 Tax=Necator americanus TaxID=51031 RepID=A0ABR1D1M8_NECAM
MLFIHSVVTDVAVASYISMMSEKESSISRSSVSRKKSKPPSWVYKNTQRKLSDIQKEYESDKGDQKAWPGETETKLPKNESCGSAFFEAMVLSGLILSSDSLFFFPFYALANGGYFFLIIYFIIGLFIVFPLVHLEMFVSQFTQSGILKSMRLYGSIYTGIGVIIVVLSALNEHVILYNEYFLIKHMGNVADDLRQVVDCRSGHVHNGSNCLSSYNDHQCRLKGYRFFFINGKCTDNKESTPIINPEIATLSYAETAGVCPQAKVLPDDDVDDSWRCTGSLDKWLTMKTTLNRRRRRRAAARHIQQRLDMASAARHDGGYTWMVDSGTHLVPGT